MVAVDAEQVRAVRERRGWKSEDCVLLYSGNMGLGHHLEEFLAAAARMGGGNTVWAFAGGGRRLEEVKACAIANPSARIDVLPYVPQTELAASLGAADVHLVSLRSGWEGLILPSKLQAAFASGRPVIFVGPTENEAADWLLESGGGWRADEGDVEGLLVMVGEARNAAERARRGAAALAYARRHFDRTTNTERIANLLQEAVGR
jgi:glycosyltransferase involved in cell wall biosynthesis